MNWTRDHLQLQSQLHHAKQSGLYAVLHFAASAHSLSFAYVLAVASRETDIRHIRGDGGHGYGVMQLDDRSHIIPHDWETNPAEIVGTCCQELRRDLDWAAKTWPDFTDRQHLKIAAAAYNSGPHNAARGVAEGDADAHDTGHDYGADVLNRMDVFADLLQG